VSLATYEAASDLAGAYQHGTDRKVDFAIDNIDAVQGFLKQRHPRESDFQGRCLSNKLRGFDNKCQEG
jgi:flagellar biosynthesis/type III secretory pathway ATPase